MAPSFTNGPEEGLLFEATCQGLEDWARIAKAVGVGDHMALFALLNAAANIAIKIEFPLEKFMVACVAAYTKAPPGDIERAVRDAEDLK